MNPDHSNFSENFIWGAACSAFQCEGREEGDGRGDSIWDTFVRKRAHHYLGKNIYHTPLFIKFYKEDLEILRALGFRHFRFSISWPRMIPDGRGKLNAAGIDFYNRLIDHCLSLGITPWITLYHWDLPQALEDKGGWRSRDSVSWFSVYVRECMRWFGDRVKHWMVFNEPLAVSGAGYFLGKLAPGKRGMRNFLPALHHTALAIAQGGRIVRDEVPDAFVGTCFSCVHLEPFTMKEKDIRAVQRAQSVLNTLYPRLLTGGGYDSACLPVLRKMEKWMKSTDEKSLQFDFDFWGLQPYTRELVKWSPLIPYVHARFVSPEKRNAQYTVTGWEVYPDTLLHVIREFASFPGSPDLIITENGAAFHDCIKDGKVHDPLRVQFFRDYISSLEKAVSEKLPVKGYFLWSLTDNFEWISGTSSRFGIVYIDYPEGKRIIKDSALWWKHFLKDSLNL
jgi:beta-glucosidase